MQTWKINPVLKDYIMNQGAPSQSDSLLVPAYIRVKTKRTHWMYAPDNTYGSDFYTINKRPSENGNQALENVALAALKPLIDDGRAIEVTATVTQVGINSAGMQIEITDASGELEVTTFPGLGV